MTGVLQTGSVDIIDCAPSDAAALAAIHAACFAQGWSFSEFSALMTSPGVVALRDSLARGLVMVRVAADEGEVLTLGTVPLCRKMGVAAALMRAVQARVWAAGAAMLFLEVAADNDAARQLYQRLGYETVGRRARYYNRPDGAVDALVLRLLRPLS
jgi:[ribosomal protein S18]-alanine N-acetyltransferase